jgi:hypothetical protein
VDVRERKKCNNSGNLSVEANSNENSIKMLKIQMLEQILNNDENTNEDGTKSPVNASVDGREPSHNSHDDQFHGYFVQNGSTFNG